MAERTCSIEGCTRPHEARGWCATHYERWRRHGDPGEATLRRHPVGDRCVIDGCDDPPHSKNLCARHYSRVKRYGKDRVEAVATRYRWPENLLRRLRFCPPTATMTGCIEWTGKRDANGYVHLRRDGGDILAHIAVHEWLIGPIPTGHEVHHLCQNRGCVNPGHLRALSAQEHHRVHTAMKTHCKHGHEFTPENTYRCPATGWRTCRTCQREWDRRRRRK